MRLIAFRQWSVYIKAPKLESVSAAYVWHPGVNRASCDSVSMVVYPSGQRRVEPHTVVPDGGCTCGYYGWYEFNSVHDEAASLRSRLKNYGFLGDGYMYVIGIVAVRGHIVLGEYGLRAELAEPLALLATDSDPSVAPRLSEIYDVPVQSSPTSLTWYAKEYGDLVTPEYLYGRGV